jgi:hypothetical protein
MSWEVKNKFYSELELKCLNKIRQVCEKGLPGVGEGKENGEGNREVSS